MCITAPLTEGPVRQDGIYATDNSISAATRSKSSLGCLNSVFWLLAVHRRHKSCNNVRAADRAEHAVPWALLGPLDVITDRTRVDLLASSELRICHYLTTRFLTVKGPARIVVSADGVSVEAGKAVYVARETCSLPQATSAQAGIVARGIPK